jgi:hypothetical protein
MLSDAESNYVTGIEPKEENIFFMLRDTHKEPMRMNTTKNDTQATINWHIVLNNVIKFPILK